MGDIDGDGDGDVVFKAADFMDMVYDGSVFEMVSSSLSQANPEAVCDFDGDNIADAVEQKMAPKGQSVDTFKAVDADGNQLGAVKRERKVKGMYVNAVHCGDFDGDGRADIGLEEDKYFAREMNNPDIHDVETMPVQFTVYRQVAPGKFGKPETWLKTETPRGQSVNKVFDTHFVVGDLNGDDKDDVMLLVDYSTMEFMSGGLGALCGHLAAYSNGKAFRPGPVQKFVSKNRGGSSVEDATVACMAIPADIDGDGAEELVGLDRAGKADVWSAKNGKWTRTNASTRPPRGGKDGGLPTAASDVNGDGLTDLIMITDSGSDAGAVMLYAAQASGSLAAPKEVLKLSMSASHYEMVPTRIQPTP
ncbi:FG-GAP repeat domain-containing protein [Nocardioides sp. NPDC051685]|uniref:FG-GAP repeat domain-containing protein n=1 Tax=Nocardioides sp. NPDC051685 TaxID=3364334 RepID=UPI00379E1773